MIPRLLTKVRHLALVPIAAAAAPALLHAQDYTIATLAGPSGQGSADGTGATAQFDFPLGIARDAAGNFYVADSKNHTIRRITPGGVVTTLAGSPGNPGATDGTGTAARFNEPSGIAIDGAGNLFVAEQEMSTSPISFPG
jgi:sugar lactone lactonase YvrE